MSLGHGVASIAYCAIACAILAFFVFRKTRERKKVFMVVIFSIGFYSWFTAHFFDLPITFDWWKNNALTSCSVWSDGIKIVPFADVINVFDRFGLNGAIYSFLSMIREKSGLILGAMLIGLSVFDVFFCKKKKYAVLGSLLVVTLLPFFVHSSFVLFGGNVWKVADITDIVLELMFFGIGYGARRLVSFLW